MKKNTKKLLCVTLTAAMLFSLASCGSSGSTTTEPAQDETTETEAPAETEAAAESGNPAESGEPTVSGDPSTELGADAVYSNKGYSLTIPGKYDSLLFTTTPEEENVLFMCSEIASIEASNEQNLDIETAGRLFSIETVDEATLNEMLCGEMSGTEPFATDGNGTYFLFCHPTDVTFVRENMDDNDQWALWEELNSWAATVPDTFIKENAQLTSAKYGNTDLEIQLARIAHGDDVNYILSSLEFLELEPKDVDPTPYIDKLRKNVTYEPVSGDGPDGEYIVLSFPDDNMRFEFPVSTEDGCYVRQIWGENDMYKQVYKANFDDSTIDSTAVMQEWYDALAVANGKK